ncbi:MULTISPECIES: transposase [Pseudoalteromonas]|nr:MULTISPECIES: transposase [Pseudoalteromonas]MDN3409113.1 transposase [Pseudoalteromonas sp. APC 3894]MDN3416491.1 transposase [Pseudoalteromonas sp. APC 3227]MDN3420188.1 transposase [Pseudoalteromonas sp. APC 3895]MDN3423789.1 transposase [Pseudoalteromonas sp. APC 3896]MDN3488543.1 transposase [Pseudoalteromonas sp. APC 3694]
MRTLRRKTFDGIALRVNEIIGLIYGFKLHLIVNHHDKIVVAKVKKFEC